MRESPALLRGCAAVLAWATVTAVAATGSWLGLSSVFAPDTTFTPTDTVLATDLPSQTTSSSSSSPSPSESSRPDHDGAVNPPQFPPNPQDDPSPPPPSEPDQPINGWVPIGDGMYEQTFDTSGGTTVIQLSAEEAVFVSASPAEGYTASRASQSTAELVVTFVSEDETVRITATWQDGAPQGVVSSTD